MKLCANLLSRITIVTAFAILTFSIGLSAQTRDSKNKLPEIGVVASDAISLDKEIQVGDLMMRQLRGQAPIINDPLLEEYIQDIGNRLVIQAEDTKFPFTFFLINNPSINAFAFFGGHIGVHSGLIYHADTEGELASVLAHEIAHVTQRHIARGIQASKRSSPLQLAALFGSILLAIANPEAGVAAISTTQAASAQSKINYTRHNEREADRIGMQILARSGYDPRSSVSFFGKLAAKFRTNTKPPAFLLTHPLPESRITDARARAASYRPVRVPASLNFHLAKARIQARYYSNPKMNVALFENQLKEQKYVFKQAAQYGLALSLLAHEKPKQAKKIIDKLLLTSPENLFYIDAATDISVELKEYDLAIERLFDQYQHAPRNRVLALNLANVLVQVGEYTDATSVLRDYLLVNPNHLLSLDLLSDAYGENGQKLEMHQTKAEVFAAIAAYGLAIDELQTAYNYAAERQLEKLRIRARIEQLREAKSKLKKR